MSAAIFAYPATCYRKSIFSNQSNVTFSPFSDVALRDMGPNSLTASFKAT